MSGPVELEATMAEELEEVALTVAVMVRHGAAEEEARVSTIALVFGGTREVTVNAEQF